MDQGDIYLINLDPTLQTEIGKTRPGLIISINAMNHNSPRLIIAPITSSLSLGVASTLLTGRSKLDK